MNEYLRWIIAAGAVTWLLWEARRSSRRRLRAADQSNTRLIEEFDPDTNRSERGDESMAAP